MARTSSSVFSRDIVVAAIRDSFAATKDWKGMLISYQADALGDLAHTLGVYRNKGKTPELAGPIKESGF